MLCNLRAYRIQRGLTQQELAGRVGSCVSYISKIECGKREPPVMMALQFAAILDVGISQLWQLEPADVASMGAEPSARVA